MQCTLLIPHLLWPAGVSTSGGPSLEVPALERMFARGQRERFPALCIEGWLCQAFEIERQADWPVAPLTLAVDGGNPADGYWLRADPVHLRPRRQQLVLAGPELLDITSDESAQLTATLNAHFTADALVFLAPNPARWYVRLAENPDLKTTSLGEAAGGDVARMMPTGRDALRWHRTVNEVQMLLHDHPVNAAREARGAPAINSVWIWGGGIMPTAPARHFTHVFTENPLAAALATRAGLDALPMPADASSWRAANRDAADGRHLIVLEQLAGSAQYGDADAWRAGITDLEHKWFAPLLDGIGKNGLDRVDIVALDSGAATRYECGNRVRWAFWQRRRPLAAHVGTAAEK